MSYQCKIETENEKIRERYELSMGRVQEMIKEETLLSPDLTEYFKKVSKFLIEIGEVISIVESGELKEKKREELERLNFDLYLDIIGKKYEKSYANPSYSVSLFGKKIGQLLCFLYTELRGTIAYAFENRLMDITIGLELFIEIYNRMKEEKEEEIIYKVIKEAIYHYISDYSDMTLSHRISEMLEPEFSFAVDIIMKENLEDTRYLYYFGEYISDNERKIADYLNGLSQEKINQMAFTYTQGFKKGFDIARIDLSKKSVVNIRYPLGFERMVKAAILQFQEMGLTPVIYRAAVSSIHKKQHLKIGFHSTSPNRQYDYDHRMDNGLYLDQGLNERKLSVLKVCYEEKKELAKKLAGPAVIEVFGEVPFSPQSKEEAVTLNEGQQKLSVDYARDSGLLINEYIKGDEISFTIIAYPIPEIGEKFHEIFNETVKVNTLDLDVYQSVQQKIIDTLDQGTSVKITGRGENHTDLIIQLPKLNHPKQETNFENCLADVNIPVGEVFTSPKLKGTNGILHVTEVFLNNFKYEDLELTFKDGKIENYCCRNFKSKEENKKFIKESLLYQHETLPMGEFAIGTNTTAYVMGKKYGISHMLPILIAEKTGPHFAVGDTCFHMSEDMVTYNPDGKQIMAKDNEISILRKTEIEKAYYNCHTDITIPYDELGDIVVRKENGENIFIIQEGRFVLEGTEVLNIPLDEMQQ